MPPHEKNISSPTQLKLLELICIIIRIKYFSYRNKPADLNAVVDFSDIDELIGSKKADLKGLLGMRPQAPGSRFRIKTPLRLRLTSPVRVIRSG